LAIRQAQAALEPCFLALLQLLRQGLTTGDGVRNSQQLALLQADLDHLELYIDQIHLAPGQGPGSEALLHLLHGLDHLQRLHERCEEEQDRLHTAATSSSLVAERQLLLSTLEQVPPLVAQGRWPQAGGLARSCAAALDRRSRSYRQEVLAAVASGRIDVDGGTARLEAIRWLGRVSQHLERACNHLGATGSGPPRP